MTTEKRVGCHKNLLTYKQLDTSDNHDNENLTFLNFRTGKNKIRLRVFWKREGDFIISRIV